MIWNAWNRVKVEILNWVLPWPSPGIPPYRICNDCGRPAKFGERWRVTSGWSRRINTVTRCDRCENE